jgi:tetratricopeptide (TPR) repeat protein
LLFRRTDEGLDPAGTRFREPYGLPEQTCLSADTMHWLFPLGSRLLQRFLPTLFVAGAVFLLIAGRATAQSPASLPSTPKPPNTDKNVSRSSALSNSPDLKFAEAESLMEKGQLSEAEAAIRQDLQQAPKSGPAHFLLGYILYREIQAQAKRIDPNPNAIYAAPEKSLIELRDKNAKESLAEFTAGARYRTPSSFDLKIVAMDYILLGDFIDADKWLTRSLQGNPADSDGWYQLGRTKYNENRFTEAIDAFKKCLGIDATNIKAQENLGLSYAGLGDDAAAIKAYQTAIDWQASSGTKDVEAYFALGSLLLEENRPQDAIPVLVQATQIAPSVSQGHELLGKAYLHTESLAKAQTELEEAVNLSPGTGRLHCILGQIYRKQDLTSKAKAELDACAAMQKEHPPDRSAME